MRSCCPRSRRPTSPHCARPSSPSSRLPWWRTSWCCPTPSKGCSATSTKASGCCPRSTTLLAGSSRCAACQAPLLACNAPLLACDLLLLGPVMTVFGLPLVVENGDPFSHRKKVDKRNEGTVEQSREADFASLPGKTPAARRPHQRSGIERSPSGQKTDAWFLRRRIGRRSKWRE